MTAKDYEKIGVDVSKLTIMGSANIIVQAWLPETDPEEIAEIENNGDVNGFYGDNYMPRKNSVWSFERGEMSEVEFRQSVEETIERMKIAQYILKNDVLTKKGHLYYWEAEDESEVLRDTLRENEKRMREERLAEYNSDDE